jgi:hypothetical protein
MGLSWFGVEQISTFPPLCTHNQAQPDPNLDPAAALNFSLNASKEPKASSIAEANSPDGVPPPFGDITSQKRLWLKNPPPLFLTAVLDISKPVRISSIPFPAKSVPSMAAFNLVV